jgi:tetratricopeptide (TPR) repeat protein
MTRGLVTSSRYSPGNLSGDSLEKLFVGRERLLREVLKRIAASAAGKEKHFLLLIGPRGMGKTHFVSLVYHKLRSDPAYAEIRAGLKIAYLNEEEWGVASFLDLLVRILQALAAEARDSGLVEGIEKVYETFKRSPQSAMELAESLLVAYIQGGTLLLICENLGDLFEGLDEEGQSRWRSFIQQHPFWTILATTPALFAGIQLQTSPFYNFFTIKHLDRLDFDTALELLRQKAMLEGRQKLAELLLTPVGRARVRAIHHLAGGNHRVYVIMSDFIDEESLDDLVTPFMRMADDLTPYYQDRMRQLSPQQRKLVEFLCHESRPVIVKDIASRSLISQQTAAKQLGELAKSSFVVSTRVGRESYYELAEPLMRICVEIKDNRTEYLRLFVDFLRRWFTGRELRSRLEVLRQVAFQVNKVDQIHLAAAVQDLIQNPREPFLESLDEEIRQCYHAGDYQGFAAAISHLLKERPSAVYFQMMARAFCMIAQYEKAVHYAKEGLEQHPGDARLWVELAKSLMGQGRMDEALRAAQQAVHLEADNDFALVLCARLHYAIGEGDQAIRDARRALALRPGNPVASKIVVNVLVDRGDHEESEREARAWWEGAPHEPDAIASLARVLWRQQRYSELVTLVESAFIGLLEAEDVRARFVYKNSLAVWYGESLARMGRVEDAMAQFDRVLQAEPEHYFALMVKARVCMNLGRYQDAGAVLLRVLRGQVPEQLDAALLETLIWLGRVQEVLSALEERETQAGLGPLLKYKLRALVMLGRGAEAMDAIGRVRQSVPGDVGLMVVEAEALVDVAGFGAALGVLAQVLASRGEHDEEKIVEAFCNVLLAESRARGPVAMARQIPQFRSLLEKHQMVGTLPAVLSSLLEAQLAAGKFDVEGWSSAIPTLEQALSDLPECSIPFQMLSVAVRYRRSGDRGVLLELPLEQRALLMNGMQAVDTSDS